MECSVFISSVTCLFIVWDKYTRQFKRNANGFSNLTQLQAFWSRKQGDKTVVTDMCSLILVWYDCSQQHQTEYLKNVQQQHFLRNYDQRNVTKIYPTQKGYIARKVEYQKYVDGQKLVAHNIAEADLNSTSPVLLATLWKPFAELDTVQFHCCTQQFNTAVLIFRFSYMQSTPKHQCSILYNTVTNNPCNLMILN